MACIPNLQRRRVPVLEAGAALSLKHHLGAIGRVAGALPSCRHPFLGRNGTVGRTATPRPLLGSQSTRHGPALRRFPSLCLCLLSKHAHPVSCTSPGLMPSSNESVLRDSAPQRGQWAGNGAHSHPPLLLTTVVKQRILPKGWPLFSSLSLGHFSARRAPSSCARRGDPHTTTTTTPAPPCRSHPRLGHPLGRFHLLEPGLSSGRHREPLAPTGCAQRPSRPPHGAGSSPGCCPRCREEPNRDLAPTWG